MPEVSVEIFDLEDAGIDVTVVLQGAQANAQTSAVSIFEQSNSVDVALVGASALARPGALGVGTGGSDIFNPDFPRMGAYRIGRRSWGDNPSGSTINHIANLDEVDHLARFHYSIINGQQGRGSGFVTAVADWISRAKAINPDHIFYHYTDMQETGQNDASVPNQKLLSETGPTGNGGTWTPNDWFARTTSGAKISLFPGLDIVNPTVDVTPDSDGLIYPEWYADRETAGSFDPHNASGLVLHLYDDVVDHKLRTNNTDLNRNGVNDRQNSDWNLPGSEGQISAEKYRQGHRIFSDRMIANTPGMLSTGNFTTWAGEYTSPNPDDAPPIHTFYEGAFHGGINEGQSIAPPSQATFAGVYSDGTINPTFGSFRLAQNNHMYVLRHTLAPRHVLNQWAVEIQPDSLNPVVGTHITPKAMAVARWAICSTLLDDGYVYVTNVNIKFDSSPHFDEYGTYNTSTTGLSKGWLGQPVDAAQSVKEDITKQSSVWLGSDLNGIFKREFDNGLVLLNSTKSVTGSITIPVFAGANEANGELEAGKWRRFQGFQDPNHNNGQVVNSNLSINSIDAIILVRV